MSRLLLSYPSWKLSRDAPKLSHLRLSCLVKLAVCLFSVRCQLDWMEGSGFNFCFLVLLLHFLFQVGKVSLLESNLRNVGTEFIQTGFMSIYQTCWLCGGTGHLVMHQSWCKSCKGARVVKGSKSVKLDIMPGVDNNETFKVFRSCGADPDGNQPGDLYVTIKVREDPVFHREGASIHVDAVLSVAQAILGGTIQVPTLTGDAVLKVCTGTQPGQKVVLKNKGNKTRNSYLFGDQSYTSTSAYQRIRLGDNVN